MSNIRWQETEDWVNHSALCRTYHQNSLSDVSVAEQRKIILDTLYHPLDLLRRSLCNEPRGHADMYGGFVTKGNDSSAHFGVLFFHGYGFSTACGHGTIALGYWAIAKGLVEPGREESVDVVIDVPSGRVIARASCKDGAVQHVDFHNVASSQISKAVSMIVQKGETDLAVSVSLMYGGAVIAFVDVARLGINVEPQRYQELIAHQRQIKARLADFRHLGLYEVFGVCFYQEVEEAADWIRQKTVMIYGDGAVDRSPCGSGTAARVAVLLAEGRMNMSRKFIHESIIGTTFEATVSELTEQPAEYPACIARIRGRAFMVGRMNFCLDSTDPLREGFALR